MLSRVPIRVRLTLWYVLLLAVILAAFATGVYLLLRHSLYSNLDDSLEAMAGSILSTIQFDEDRPRLPNTQASNDPTEEEHFARIFDAEGQVTFTNTPVQENVPVDDQAVNAALSGEGTARKSSFADDDEILRVITLPILRGETVLGALEVGQSEEEVSDTLSSLLLILGIGYPVTLVLATFGGIFLARRALSPIDKITRTARNISAEDLSQRLNMDLPNDEVGNLAQTFDEMIGRLEDAFRRQRQFTADASHELRTPLTVIKGQIDVSLQKEREAESYREVLQTVNNEVDRLIRVAASLLTLTRADTGKIPLTFEALNVSELLSGVLEQVRPAAVEKSVELSLDPGPPATIHADEDLLLQLLLNLLDNAIKYTLASGRVQAGWNVKEDGIELWVRDTGIGIADEHIPHIFDRFYRVDKARSRNEGGVGLGLAISQWIVEAHGGSIRVESTPDSGTTFTVQLPISR